VVAGGIAVTPKWRRSPITPWMTKRAPDPGAYGHIKIAEVVSCLPPRTDDEYRQLSRIKRKDRSPAQQGRMEELWAEASARHKQDRQRRAVEIRTPDIDLVLYALEIGNRQRARAGLPPMTEDDVRLA
jgi:hypothetical protein